MTHQLEKIIEDDSVVTVRRTRQLLCLTENAHIAAHKHVWINRWFIEFKDGKKKRMVETDSWETAKEIVQELLSPVIDDCPF